MSSSNIKDLMEILSKTATAPAGLASSADAEFGDILRNYDGSVETTKYDKDGNVEGDDKDVADGHIKTVKDNEDDFTVTEVNGPYGKVLNLETTGTTAAHTAAVNFLNAHPSILNDKLRSMLHKKEKSHSGASYDMLPSMSGGASFIGEFEALKNIHSLEKQTIDMIGGGSKWAPALSPEATSRSSTFRKVLASLTQRLKSNGKELAAADQTTLTDAIDGLEKKEREAYTKLAYLKKYTALYQKHKNTDDAEIKKALENKKMEDFVGDYMHTLKRVERKSSKLWAAMGSLVVQAGPFLLL